MLEAARAFILRNNKRDITASLEKKRTAVLAAKAAVITANERVVECEASLAAFEQAVNERKEQRLKQQAAEDRAAAKEKMKRMMEEYQKLSAAAATPPEQPKQKKNKSQPPAPTATAAAAAPIVLQPPTLNADTAMVAPPAQADFDTAMSSLTISATSLSVSKK